MFVLRILGLLEGDVCNRVVAEVAEAGPRGGRTTGCVSDVRKGMRALLHCRLEEEGSRDDLL